jgi:hypothetical protein
MFWSFYAYGKPQQEQHQKKKSTRNERPSFQTDNSCDGKKPDFLSNYGIQGVFSVVQSINCLIGALSKPDKVSKDYHRFGNIGIFWFHKQLFKHRLNFNGYQKPQLMALIRPREP